MDEIVDYLFATHSGRHATSDRRQPHLAAPAGAPTPAAMDKPDQAARAQHATATAQEAGQPQGGAFDTLLDRLKDEAVLRAIIKLLAPK